MNVHKKIHFSFIKEKPGLPRTCKITMGGFWPSFSGTMTSRLAENLYQNDQKLELCFGTEFDTFCQRYPSWDSGIFFWTHQPGLRDKLVIRQMQTQPSHMLGPVCVLQYLLTISNNQRQPMIDVGCYVREQQSSDDFEIITLSIPAIAFFCKIANISSDRLMSLIVSNINPLVKQTTLDCVMHGLQRAPGLISVFPVDQHFLKGTPQSQVDYSSIVGFHSMVLIGYRITHDTIIFLVQNWWAEQYFREITAEYLISARATVSFVQGPIQTLHAKLPCLPLEWTAATTSVDSSEGSL
jgi:hypothetical protein